MTRDAILAEVRKLPADERMELLEIVLLETAPSIDDEPMPDWHREELDRRLNDPTEQATLSWDDGKRRKIEA